MSARPALDYYQSWADKTHDLKIPGGEIWTPLSWTRPGGSIARIMPVLVTARHDIDAAVRFRFAGTLRPWCWVRIQRYPSLDDTHWFGPLRAPTTETALYIPWGALDELGAIRGNGYGIDVKHDGRRGTVDGVYVDQRMLKLDPRPVFRP